MGLETATYIGQLVATNPTATDPVSQGDDQLRLVKAVLQAQFPGLGNAAVSVTAAQLNAVTDKLLSFNGRTVEAVVPTDGDYDLDMLGDVDSALSPSAGDVLTYDGAEWVADAVPSPSSGWGHWDTVAGFSGDSPHFTNERANTIPAGLATVKNNGSGGFGWQLTAVADCLVHLHYQQTVAASLAGTDADTAIGYESASNAFPATASANRVARSRIESEGGSAEDGAASVSVSILLLATDTLTLFYDLTTGTTGAATVTCTVQSG